MPTFIVPLVSLICCHNLPLECILSWLKKNFDDVSPSSYSVILALILAPCVFVDQCAFNSFCNVSILLWFGGLLFFSIDNSF